MVGNLEWARDGANWIKTKCSNYYIYDGHPGRFVLYMAQDGGIVQHSVHQILEKAKDAAQKEDEAICTW
jgi:hypothetical protein